MTQMSTRPSLQLDRYDNLKLTQLEKIREELADIRQRLESIDETLREIDHE